MPVVSVINYKGGVGKTTLTANLGAELAYQGKQVLMIDLDPQASLTFSFVAPDDWQANLADRKSIKAWFDSFDDTSLNLADLIHKPTRVATALGRSGKGGCLDVIPSHLGLINVDLELATELGGATLRKTKLNYLRVHQRLAQGLADPAFSRYDLILIDCPPNFNIVTKTAIVASDRILIPAKPDYLSTLGIDYLQRSLDELVRDYNEYAAMVEGGLAELIDPQLLGVIFTMVQFYAERPIAALRPYIAQTKALGVPVFDTHVRENKTHFGDAPEYGVPVVLNGGQSASKLVSELEALANEFSTLVGL